jgi:hypothetical protein
LTQAATFGAAQQLAGMGREQEATQRAQQAWDYQQWLRGQEGGAQELALAQSFMPGGMQQRFERKPSRFGQVAGGLLGAAGLYNQFRGGGGGGNGSDPFPQRDIFSGGRFRPGGVPSPLPENSIFQGRRFGPGGVPSPLRQNTIYSGQLPGRFGLGG